MKRNILCFLGVVLWAACAGERTKVDKAHENGVEVVLNHVEPYRLKGQPSTFSLEKVISIDMERADLAQAGMGTAGEWDADNDGNVFVVCFKNKENYIFRFDRDGRLTGSFGRGGQGPGELQWPFLSGVSSPGQISLTDYMQKFIVYDLKGAVLREVKLTRRALHIDPLRNGKYVVFGIGSEPPKGDVYSEWLTLCDGEFKDLKILDRYESSLDNGRQVPYFMWRVSGDRIFVVNQARGYEIWVYDLEGNLVRKIRKEFRPVRVTEEIKEAVLGPDYRRSGLPQNKYFSDPLPPLNQFFTDDEGRLFVMTYEAGPNPGEYIWDVFTPDGAFVGRKALNIHWAGMYLGPRYTFAKNGYLYCHHEKESGFHELAVYRMIWK